MGIGLEPGRQPCPRDLVWGSVTVPDLRVHVCLEDRECPSSGGELGGNGAMKGAAMYRAELALL